MSDVEPKQFEIEEFSYYWTVDPEQFTAKLQDLETIMIVGFPPMGNVIPYQLKELLPDSQEIGSIYSYDFPPMVEARDEEFEIPHDELWYSAEKRLFCYVGKYPETEYIPKSAYKQAEGVARLARALNVKELYTVGVILPQQEPFKKQGDEITAFIGCFEGSNKEIPENTRKMTRRNIGRYTIIRKTGLLPGFAANLGIESYAILGAGTYPEDLRACTRALQAFKQLSGLVIEETAEIEAMFERSAEAMEARMREQREKAKAAYRGEGVGVAPNEYMYG